MRLLQLIALFVWMVSAPCLATERPNILWITAEDMSATLGCYGDEFATTPFIDSLSVQSVRYTHAFATAPVCSPARSCLITGCYATSLGTHQMRSAFPIPNKITGFPSYLRAAGYYTTNNVKTDYNTSNWKTIVNASWDESSSTAHWRNRPEQQQPFFSIFNLMTSHQSRTMVWPREKFVAEVQSRLSADEIHDPQQAPVPPYYPDTPIIRRTVARYYDCVTAMDKQVGQILAQLEEDGLAENTIVFFYSDHGSGLPRHKRCLTDSGMHVPLLVRFPKKWQHLAPKRPGETTDRLVSFVDFGPTVLSLLDIEFPEYMQGEPFLGKVQSDPREHVFGHRDRVDEVIDMSRSVRSKQYLYIRNYMPHLGWNQPTAWPDQGEIRHEFYRLVERSKMTDPQWHFAGPTRAAIELYDCENDPQNLVNLAESADHQTVLTRLAMAGLFHRKQTRDVGFVPEPEMARISTKKTMWDAAREGDLDLGDLNLAAAASGAEDATIPLRNLSSGNSSVRYWSAIALAQSVALTESGQQQLVHALADPFAAARIAAAQAIVQHDHVDLAVPVLIAALDDGDLTTVLYAARAIELLGDQAKSAIPAMKKTLARAEKILPADLPAAEIASADQDLAMFIGFSIKAFLTATGSD